MPLATQEDMYRLHKACSKMATAVQYGAQGQLWLPYSNEELVKMEQELVDALVPTGEGRTVTYKHMVPFQLPGDIGWYVFHVQDSRVYGIGYGNTPDDARSAEPFPPFALFAR